MKVRGRAQEVSRAQYNKHVIDSVAKRVAALTATWERSATPAPPEDELVSAILGMPALANLDNDLGDRLGPFYTTAGVMKVLGGVTKQAVDARRRKASILALRTSDDVWVYPVFQFAGQDVNRALLPAIRALRDSPPWSAALWFVTQNPDLDDMAPLDWAKSGLPGERIETSARRTAAEWV